MHASTHLAVSDLAQFPDYPAQERDYVSYLASSNPNCSTLSQEIEKARQHIKASLDRSGLARALNTTRIDELEQTVNNLIKRISDLEEHIGKLKLLEDVTLTQSAPKNAEVNGDAGCDLFGSDDEDDVEAEKVRAKRLAEYNAIKAQKPVEVPKSTIVLDVKPWGDDTDLHEMERLVRSIEADGLLWGQSKFVPLAYGIRKLQISCVVEDDKIGTDFLEESITQFHEHVQSVDIASFNKV